MGMEGEREGEKQQCVVAFRSPPTGDLARNPGMCPDWELNQWPFDLQSGAQSTEPHQPGLCLLFIEFIGLTLVNKIIEISGVQFYNTSSVHCTAYSPLQVKSPSITIYPSFTLS